MAFIFMATALVSLNVWVTRLLFTGEGVPRGKIVLAVMVWLVPLVGAFHAWQAIQDARRAHAQRQPEPPLAGVVAEAAPDMLEIGGAPQFPLLENMAAIHGLPFLDWRALSQWASSIGDAALGRDAASLGVRAWLLHLRDALGPAFRLYESEHAYLLSSLENVVVVATANYVATTRRRILRVLDGIAHFPAGGKSVLLVFDDEDSYYRYVLQYYPEEGEVAFSGGMFVDAGCPHFVVKRAALSAIEPVIAHEMTHSAVSDLDLPRWLDEGLAVNMEHRLTGTPRSLHTPQEMRLKHLGFWGVAEIREFWSGASFFRPDEGSLLAYDLARILVEQLARDWATFASFTVAARRCDGGAQAAREHLGVDLGAYVCALLEIEPTREWEPDAGAATNATDNIGITN